MKPDYKNWMPKGMVAGVIAGTAVLGCLFILFGIAGFAVSGRLRIILAVLLGVIFLISCAFSALCIAWHLAFSYNGKRQLSRQIVEGTARYITLPENGKGLDVGCGSGALTIACAKRNPQGTMTGIDRWGKEYASFSKKLCEQNAAAEGVDNTIFIKGDALKLDIPNESFDAVVSNYVYHNIKGVDKQALILETLRVLKKGGSFAIHDLFTSRGYGNMIAFTEELKKQGYEKVELIDTTEGLFMSCKEAKWMGLSGSALLVGRK